MQNRLSPLPLPHLVRWVIACAWVVALTGCGEETSLQSSALNGAYRVTSHTRNVEGCEQPGPELPEEERTFGLVFRIGNDPADNVMMGAPCGDTDACTVYLESTIRLRQRSGGFILPAGDDTQGWSGRALTLLVQGDVEPPVCSSDYTDYLLTSPGPGRVRLEERHHIRPLAPSADAVCNAQDLEEVGPCMRLEVLEAERL